MTEMDTANWIYALRIGNMITGNALNNSVTDLDHPLISQTAVRRQGVNCFGDLRANWVKRNILKCIIELWGSVVHLNSSEWCTFSVRHLHLLVEFWSHQLPGTVTWDKIDTSLLLSVVSRNQPLVIERINTPLCPVDKYGGLRIGIRDYLSSPLDKLMRIIVAASRQPMDPEQFVDKYYPDYRKYISVLTIILMCVSKLSSNMPEDIIRPVDWFFDEYDMDDVFVQVDFALQDDTPYSVDESVLFLPRVDCTLNTCILEIIQSLKQDADLRQ